MVVFDDGDMVFFFEIVEFRLFEVIYVESGEGGEGDIVVFYQDWDFID